MKLSPRVALDFYPKRPYDAFQRIFAYHFMTTEGRNIATWIPDVALCGVTMQTGFDGRGCEYDPALIRGTEDIAWWIEGADKAATPPVGEQDVAARRPRP